jgi:hypothetical protein
LLVATSLPARHEGGMKTALTEVPLLSVMAVQTEASVRRGLAPPEIAHAKALGATRAVHHDRRSLSAFSYSSRSISPAA